MKKNRSPIAQKATSCGASRKALRASERFPFRMSADTERARVRACSCNRSDKEGEDGLGMPKYTKVGE